MFYAKIGARVYAKNTVFVVDSVQNLCVLAQIHESEELTEKRIKNGIAYIYYETIDGGRRSFWTPYPSLEPIDDPIRLWRQR